METEQHIQESQYHFPYHHLVRSGNGKFSQVRQLRWGYIYIAYILYILDYLRRHNFSSLLDVGCGDGKLLHEIHDTFGSSKKLVGVDYSKTPIAFARAFTPEVVFHAGDITDRAFMNNTYDVITLIETLEHIPPEEIPVFVKGIYDRLSNNGILILTVPSSNTPVAPKHYQHFDIKTLENTLDPYFSILEFQFLNKKGAQNWIISTLLSNRFFILNWQRAINFIFRYYMKNLQRADEKNGMRIFAVCRKKK